MAQSTEVTFLTFFIIWARLQGWKVPLLHVRICTWLDHCTDPERVLQVFRGAAKSTIYAVYKAYRLYKNRSHRSLVWSADNETAGMLTADTINVLRNHPLCRGMLPSKPGAKRFWVSGARDARNASMRAVGVSSNATGARADDIDFDDIEVPGNIETPEARLKLRQRISESTHIAVPGAQKTYIGTPHAHDSIYSERIAGGAAMLKIPLFEHSVRYTHTLQQTRFAFSHPVGDDGLYVLAGIHKGARILVEGRDYIYDGTGIIFDKPPGVVLDICSQCAWPERFTRDEIERRRCETRTLNAWDSQYQLEAKPLNEVRLDPERIIPYAVKPEIRIANNEVGMWLGSTRIVGAAAYWDCSLGKVKSDASAFTLMLTDARGQLYWQFALGLVGELDEQCKQIRAYVMEYQIPRVVVETNGPGGFVPPILRKHLAGTGCGVGEEFSIANKQKRILDAFDAPLSSRFIWAHLDVLNGPVWNQMRDFNPELRDQPDDYLDSAAGAIAQTPIRIGKIVRNPDTPKRDDWRPEAGEVEVPMYY